MKPYYQTILPNHMSSHMLKSYVYVLGLKNNKYYIGITNNPQRRFVEHSNNSTKWVNQWTVDHSIGMNVFSLTHPLQEDVVTKEYMMTYGIMNVRGGTYSNFILNRNQLEILQREFDTAYCRCFKCGADMAFGHSCSTTNHLKFCYYCHGTGHRTLKCPYRYRYE